MGRIVHQRRSRCQGLSLIELLLALAISALLLTATMLAIDASFVAYGSAAEQASTQSAARMVKHRMLQLIRTSTAHGPLLPDPGSNPPAVLVGNTITSPYMEMIDSQQNLVRVEYRPDTDELWLIFTPPGGPATEQPILGGVTAATFTLNRRTDEQGLLVLDRATIDMTFEPTDDNTLAIENGPAQSVRVIASTMPRKLED